MNKIVKKDGEIIHYGVVGMRWGVRKDRDSLGKRTSDHMKRSVKQKYDGRGLRNIKKSVNQKYDGRGIRNIKKSFNQKYDGRGIRNIKKSFNQKYGNFLKNIEKLSPDQKAFIRNFLGNTMILSGATMLYLSNKENVDLFIARLLHK